MNENTLTYFALSKLYYKYIVCQGGELAINGRDWKD